LSPRNLIERLFHPERLNIILGKLADRRSEKATEIDRRVSALVAEISTAEDKLKRLYTMVENDPTDLDDILKDRIAALKSSRDGAKEALARIKLQPKPNSSMLTQSGASGRSKLMITQSALSGTRQPWNR
jgi:hypothetical protein